MPTPFDFIRQIEDLIWRHRADLQRIDELLRDLRSQIHLKAIMPTEPRLPSLSDLFETPETVTPEILPTVKHERKSWTKEEDHLLRLLAGRGWSPGAIGEIVGRTAKAVERRTDQIGYR